MNKNRYINKGFILIVIFMIITVSSLAAYSILLPDVWPSPSLPYLAVPDHYSGPACVQMILNSVPSVANRQYHSQSDIYTSIMGHNVEPTEWFSDPAGVEGALEDPALISIGHWSDYSGTDRDYILGKMAYYMNYPRYMTPVSIGPDEHWVTVFGMQTIGTPNWAGTTDVALILFYDPMPGTVLNTRVVSYATWTSSPELWGTPHNNPASAWHNKYIAIIEPPKIDVKLKIKRWVIEGKILPPNVIVENYYRWQRELEYNDRMPEVIQLLYKNPPIMKPVLINARDYSYYLIPYEKSNMAAIFNAYTGTFEEFAYSEQRLEYCFNRDEVMKNLAYQLEKQRLILLDVKELELLYDAYMKRSSRLLPVWKAQVIVRKECCKEYYLNIVMNTGGEIIEGLGDLEIEQR